MPLRQDAQRNRANLITVARAAFVASTGSVPLETIARIAGLGIGTLYRHFPTREFLVEAVYAAELEELVNSAKPLLEALPADIALREWLQRYSGFVTTKRGMFDTLREGLKSGMIETPKTRTKLTETVTSLIHAGAQQGVLRSDVEPDNVTTLMLGVFLSAAATTTTDQVGSLLDLLVDALRPRA